MLGCELEHNLYTYVYLLYHPAGVERATGRTGALPIYKLSIRSAAPLLYLIPSVWHWHWQWNKN